MIVKIFFGEDDCLLLNVFGKRIILIDIFNGKNYIFEGEERVRTYVFLSIKYTEKKITFYQYHFIIIENDLDLGDGGPLGLEISRIRKKVNKSNYEGTGKNLEEEKNNQWFFIFCFLSNKKIFRLITNYNRLSLDNSNKKEK